MSVNIYISIDEQIPTNLKYITYGFSFTFFSSATVLALINKSGLSCSRMDKAAWSSTLSPGSLITKNLSACILAIAYTPPGHKLHPSIFRYSKLLPFCPAIRSKHQTSTCLLFFNDNHLRKLRPDKFCRPSYLIPLW